VFTVALGLYFSLDSQLGQTYGPLLGIIGLLLWSYLTSAALYLGFAFTAQLESVRAGQRPGREEIVTVPEARTAAMPETRPA
jgi:uncharacterized BrkB/YihY/UPF0761 family membrane protein